MSAIDLGEILNVACGVALGMAMFRTVVVVVAVIGRALR